MIIIRYLLGEVSRTQLGVFLVLMTIFISQKFVRVLGDASDGGIPGDMVMTFIALTVPHLIGIMLPLSLFLGILLAYGRIYAENEMTVFHACGVSEWYVVRVTLIAALITALITGAFTLYLSPLAAESEYQVKEKLAKDIGVSALVPGRFQKTSNEKAVVYVRDIDKDNRLQQVFVAQLPDEEIETNKSDKTSLIYAANGRVIEEENGEQRLMMEMGNRYQKNKSTGEFETVNFGKYEMQIQEQKVEHKRRKLTALPTLELMKDPSPQAVAEVQWRFSFPLSVMILTLIAVPLSVVNPRQGKFAKMFPALLLFLCYFLLLTSGRTAIEDGVIAPSVGLWPIHLIAFFLGWTLLLRSRSSGKKIKARLKGR
ncbi:LPS export ABC transporter permease LptF [Thalassotalea mangrovi]|uniref:Lipopolysaccharide export system permease protein LptF n=1 Tax=Thalassotalea mangrovi TaxID=2572245 RepID=A0A4U1B8L1_9GAMM|nr:LPS export ABC transporter permease LptF [Thalassotalea mangrovi]TKB46936.1 LPS export ABC transporter permease LptF [Thalassotalea mangrovi]